MLAELSVVSCCVSVTQTPSSLVVLMLLTESEQMQPINVTTHCTDYVSVHCRLPLKTTQHDCNIYKKLITLYMVTCERCFTKCVHFFDQQYSTRNWLHIVTRVLPLLLLLLLLLLFLLEQPFQKSLRFRRFKCDRDEIWWKLSARLGVNTHRLTESHFLFGVTVSRWRPWLHLMQKTVTMRWMNPQRQLLTAVVRCKHKYKYVPYFWSYFIGIQNWRNVLTSNLSSNIPAGLFRCRPKPIQWIWAKATKTTSRCFIRSGRHQYKQ